MCGIAGFSGTFNQALLTQMGHTILHRGPDDAGEKFFAWPTHSVGLAHRRLAIIDLSKEGHQPMTTHCACCRNAAGESLWLTYNGELYNYRELRRELIRTGHRFTSQSDSEVLLHLYAELGTAMLEKLHGIFSLAIYDNRSHADVLFLARDGLGVKPLYYSETSAGFLFASELKALLACDNVSTSIDPIAIHYYLSYLWCPGQETALESVKKIQPGEAMLVQQGKITKRWFFYDLPYQGQPHSGSMETMVNGLDHHLTVAVERQLMSDVPVGAFLSGGVDSSAIVAIAKKLHPDALLQTYCIDFPQGMKSEGSSNDLFYAQKVARHLQVPLRTLEIQADMMQHLPHMLYHLDEPQADPAAIHVYLIAKQAREDGIKVLLSGAGGDDIFSGYRRHQALQLEKHWSWLPQTLRHKIAVYANHLISGDQRFFHLRHHSVRRLATLLATIGLPDEQRLLNHFLWGTERMRRNLYSKDMQAYLLEKETCLPLAKSLARIPHEKDQLNRMLYLESKHFLADHNLNYTDKMAMSQGVEVRVPLLDLDLIDYAAHIPSRLKLRSMTTKYLFKKAMEAYLPKAVIYRKKAGFGAPLRLWLHQQLQPLIDQTLSPAALNQRGIFSPQAVDQLIRLNKSGKIDASYTIFSLLCIELWCQLFIDSKRNHYRFPAPLSESI